MSAFKLTNLVKGTVTFMHYAKGELWYKTESGFEFPVPVSDTGDAIFQASDKGMFFMRWIRKHIELIEQAKADQSVA
jgi:hypothetical protein